MYQQEGNRKIGELKAAAAPLMDRLVNHRLYGMIQTPADVLLFMEHHVFAVWDFMSLLKSLQQSLTCTELPWVPRGNRQARRLINQIVLEEESDEDPAGGFISHFELYRQAMQTCGAQTGTVDDFLELVSSGMEVPRALIAASVPESAAQFVRKTWEFVSSGSPVCVATAFTFGREEAIPGMFISLLADLDQRFPGQYGVFRYYLDRHVALDGDVHSHLAGEMLVALCGEDASAWEIAKITLLDAIQARITMWDGIAEQISLQSKNRHVAA